MKMDTSYRLNFPDQIDEKVENLVRLWGQDLELSNIIVRSRFHKDKIHVKVRLPEESQPKTDWNWYHFSARPKERVRELLAGGAKLENPRFIFEKSEDGKKDYFLRFQLQRSELGGSKQEKSGIWNRLVTILIVGLVFVLFSLTIYSFFEIPFKVVASDSMEPVLNKGDIIYTPDPEGGIKVGDIVSIRVPGGFQKKYDYPGHIIHKVVDIDGDYLETKGIAGGEDPFKSRVGNVTGVYTGIDIPLAGHIVLFFQTLWGRIYAIILISTFSLYKAVPPLIEKRRKRDSRINRALRTAVKTRDSLAAFSSAMSNYARHLKSHTSAVKNLAETANSLNNVVSNLDKKLKESE